MNEFLKMEANDTLSSDSSSSGTLTSAQFSWIIIGASVFVMLIIAVIGVILYKKLSRKSDNMAAVISLSEGENAMPYSKARNRGLVSSEDCNVLLKSDSLNQGSSVEERQNDFIESVEMAVQIGEDVYVEDTELDE